MMGLADIENNVTFEPNSGCWLWVGACTKAGYGVVTVGGKGRGVRPAGKRYYAHQYSWMLKNGEISKGMFILHKCDVRACVNPDHLFAGSQLENIRDMDKKGRRVSKPFSCQQHWAAKLTNAQAHEIRKSKESGVFLAKKYQVSTNTISKIRLGKIWKKLGENLGTF